MRILSSVIVGFAVALLLSSWYEKPRPADEVAGYLSAEIRVTGTGNTLASLAARINNPLLFSYDSQNRTALAHASLIIEGDLQLGHPDDPESGETLALVTKICGDLRIAVPAGGSLQLYHSFVRTESRMLTQNACSRGYALFVDGSLTMEDSHISYISGSTSQVLRGDASAVIRRSSFSYCDGSALSCIGVDGSRITIDECEILGSGNYGLVVGGSTGSPLEISRSVIDAAAGAVLITDRQSRLKLIDCVVGRSKIAFTQAGGEVAIAWTRRIRVIDGATGSPQSGFLVRATGSTGSAPEQIIEARTDEQGIVDLVLTEWIARPGVTRRVEGNNGLTPYRISVLDRNGALLHERTGLEVRGPRSEPILIDL